MTNWDKITGNTAMQLAEQGNVARPGIFAAAAIKWTGAGEAPFLVKITGTLKCGYCGWSSQFSLEAMTGRVSCSGCGNTYSLFNINKEIDGKEGRIITASVYSHGQGTGIVLPQIDVTDVVVLE